MRAVLVLARAEVRRRWRSLAVLTALVGLSTAVVLALVAGARRTDSSLARFQRYSRSADLEVTAGYPTGAQLSAFERTRGIVAVGRLYQMVLSGPPGSPNLAAAAQLDSTFGTAVDRPLLVAGRVPHARAPLELAIGESLAARLRVGVGDDLRLSSWSPGQVADALAGRYRPVPEGPDLTFRVVGIVRRPLDLGGRGAAGGVVLLTPGFLARYRDQVGSFAGTVLRVRTEHGAGDVPRVARAARRLFGSFPQFQNQSIAIEGRGAQNAVDVTTVALWIAAAIAGMAAVVGIGIALGREISLADVDQLTLRALGLRRADRLLAAGAVAVPVAVGGALVAAIIGTLASPLFPIGVAAKAEPDPGLRLDIPVVVIGLAAVAAVVLVLALFAGVRISRTTVRAEPARPARSFGLRPAMNIGVRFALDRRAGSRSLPVWSSLLGATFGVTVVTAVALFAVSLDRLVSTPAAYGWTWSVLAGDRDAQPPKTPCGRVGTRLTTLRQLSAVASLCEQNLEIDGRPVAGWAFTDLRGHIGPTIVEGRAPRAPNEVALGADTLDALRRSLGATAMITGPGGSRRYRIVGRAVFVGLSDPEPLADGAAFTGPGLARLASTEGAGWNLVVRLRPDAPRAATIAELRRIGGAGNFPPTGPELPAEIDRVRQIDGLPVALGAFVTVVALAAVGYALVTTVRRRRHDLGVLKALGFERRHLRATVAWHATTIMGLGVLAGVPLGLVVGRIVWRAVADELGVSARAVWPTLALVVLVPAALLVVNAVAVIPARDAARTRPAVVLRSE